MTINPADFGATEDKLRATYRALGETLNDGIQARDETRTFPHEAWRICADHGLLGFAVPKAYGGSELGTELDGLIALEAFAETCRDNALVFALAAQMWTVQHPILRFGSEEQKSRLLPRLTQGGIGAHALSEPDSGSDAFAMSTLARPVDGGYVINGRKRYVSLAPIADVILVFATVNPDRGKWGITGFLLEKDAVGLAMYDSPPKMGLKSVPWAEIEFNECFVPVENRIGSEGSGFAITMASLEFERASIIFAQIGTMQRQLDETIAFAKDRQQFDTPIGQFQSVANRIVEMKLRLETVKLLSRKVHRMLMLGEPVGLDSALLKYHVSEAFVASSMDAIRVRGAAGYTSAYDSERELRDAMGLVFAGGTSDIQRNIIARELGL